MLNVLRQTWALQLGMFLLLVGNGIQGTLLGVRGSLEFYSAETMSYIMAGYFVGFLGGSKLAPRLIRRVGHVRVFAALGSLISAAMILFAALVSPVAWIVLRVVIGFCFSGVYVVAESWLNDNSTNDTRGKTLSIYIIVQMVGIVCGQALMNVGDPGGFSLFILSSVLISIAFAPVLLSVSPAPLFETSAPMSTRELVKISPLGAVGAFCLGALFAALWGMSAVYGTESGLSVSQISMFVAAIYIGGMVCQYPIGWLSDRMDRRLLILVVAMVCAAAALVGTLIGQRFEALLLVSFIMGGVINPLYSLIIAYTNDHIEHEDMAAAAGGLIFINGVGAIGGPLVVGWMIGMFGPAGFFIYIAAVTAFLALFALYRMTARAAAEIDQPATYTPVSPGSSPVAVDMAQEHAIEQATSDADE